MTTISRYRGDTRPDVINVTLKSTGVPVDITGASLRLTVDPDQNPASAANNLFSLAGTVLDAASGRVSFTPTALQADHPPGTYYYDIQLVDNAGIIETIGKGKYTFIQDITKS